MRRLFSSIATGLALCSLVVAICVAMGGAWLAWTVYSHDLSRESILKRANSSWAVIRSTEAGFRPQDVQLIAPLHLPTARVPEHVRDVFLTAEDRWFEAHPGINPLSFGKAIVKEFGARFGLTERSGGGSTITQQLVKNLILNQQRAYRRKVKELAIAFYIEMLFTKDEILTMYLNNIFFGNGSYGIEAAARHYFGRSVAYDRRGPVLTTGEAAVLALSVRSPSIVNFSTQPGALTERAKALVERMAQRGLLTAAEKQTSLASLERPSGSSSWDLATARARDFALDTVFPDTLKRSDEDMVIWTTIEPESQLYADRAAAKLIEQASRIDPAYDNAAVVVLKPDGSVVALSGAVDYGRSGGFNVVAEGRRSPGSTMKPFVYLCALEHGMTPNSMVEDVARNFTGDWTPRNSDNAYLGTIEMREALALSRNPPAVSLWYREKDCFEAMMASLGTTGTIADGPTAILGNAAVPLLDVARWYAALANGGTPVEPFSIWHARALDGRTLYDNDPDDSSAEPIAPVGARCELEGMLRRVVSSRGTGKNAAFSHPVAGKTGTSEGGRDALFVGYTGHYVAALWVGATGASPKRQIGGGDLPARVFANLMATLHQGLKPEPLPCDRPEPRGLLSELAASEAASD